MLPTASKAAARTNPPTVRRTAQPQRDGLDHGVHEQGHTLRLSTPRIAQGRRWIVFGPVIGEKGEQGAPRRNEAHADPAAGDR